MRQHAILLFPDGDDLECVESLRRRFDPHASLLAAHVTLVFPFESQEPMAVLRSHIIQATSGIAPFALGIGTVSVMDDEYVVVAVDRGRELIVSLHDRLYGGVLTGTRSLRHTYVPHLTIGRSADPIARAAMVEHARSGATTPSLLARAVSLFRVDDDRHGAIEFSVSLEA